MIDRPKKTGKSIEEIEEGESLSLTETLEDSRLLIYMGMTNDLNPLYTEKLYAQANGYSQQLVPSALLTDIISSALSKFLPGPGSHIVNLSINFIRPVMHHETLTFTFEVIKVDQMKEVVTVSVEAVASDNERVIDAMVLVKPPKKQLLNQPTKEEGITNE